jgi:cytochrome c-type biogenesis protein CcmF
MLLGTYFFEYKVGSTPFALLRHEMVNAPIFQRADYLSFIQDGNGLNPLLQNYWMVIHPPILFLGFASTLVPFSFALSGLMNRNFSYWTKPVMPWALFSTAVLGTGIMMGGAWAYEALTFGGYWAWDPVENASLVPWITLIAGVHTALVFNKTGRSLRMTYVFFLLTFVLVLYSTFLTRSGILGDTSVHAFTDLGMSGQLVFYMAGLSIPAIVLLLIYWKRIPSIKKEENIFSREFWIFIGSLIFLLSSMHIAFNTSLPVWNKLFGTNLAVPSDAVTFYNKVQLWAGVFIAILSASALYLKFKNSDAKQFRNRILLLLGLTVPITIIIAIAGKFDLVSNIILLFAALFGVIANLYYFVIVLSGKLKLSGAAVAHLGFALTLLGILISSAKKETISFNSAGVDFGKEFSEAAQRANMLLYKNVPVKMDKYTVTYVGDSVSEPNYYYKVNYEVFDSATGQIKDRFTLFPNAQINPKMGLIANPDTRHYLTKDLYTHVTSVPDKTKQQASAKEEFKPYLVEKGDTIFTKNSYVILEDIARITSSKKVEIKPEDLVVGADLLVKTMEGQSFSAQPLFYIHGNRANLIDDKLPELGLTFRLNKIIPEENKVELHVAQSDPEPDFVVMTAIVFPYINLLWMGITITILGFVISMVRTLQKGRSVKKTITQRPVSEKVMP